jgi:hypothetical protein
MRTAIIHIYLVVALASTAQADTKCFAVEHQDHDEAVCVGDEKLLAEKSVPTKSIPSASVAQQTGQPAPEKAAGVTPTGSPDNNVVNEKPALRSGGMGSDTAAHLARRKALAIKKSLQLNRNARPSEPDIEQVPK